jgi:hypothetical protein
MFSRFATNLISSRIQLNKIIKLGNFKRFESTLNKKRFNIFIYLVSNKS